MIPVLRANCPACRLFPSEGRFRFVRGTVLLGSFGENGFGATGGSPTSVSFRAEGLAAHPPAGPELGSFGEVAPGSLGSFGEVARSGSSLSSRDAWRRARRESSSSP